MPAPEPLPLRFYKRKISLSKELQKGEELCFRKDTKIQKNRHKERTCLLFFLVFHLFKPLQYPTAINNMLRKNNDFCLVNTFSTFSCFMRDNQQPLLSFTFSILLLTLCTFSISSTAASSPYWIILVCLRFYPCGNQSTLLIMLAAILSTYFSKLCCSCGLT